MPKAVDRSEPSVRGSDTRAPSANGRNSAQSLQQPDIKDVWLLGQSDHDFWERRHLFILALIVAGATGLRFFKLGDWSFWGDELYTIRDALYAVSSPGLHPVSFVLTGFALNLLGISEWSARLVSALIGIVSIPILYFPTRKIFGTGTALVSGALLAISPWHLYWSQNARFYTAMLLFYTIALFLFYFALEEDRPAYLLLSLVFVGLAFKERLTALLFVPVVVTYIMALLALPWLGYSVGRPKGLRWRNMLLFFGPSFLGGAYFAFPELSNWSRWLESFGRINNNPVWLTAGVVFYTRVAVICFGLAGLGYLLLHSRARLRRTGLLLGASALVPLILIAGVSLVHYTANRYVFISLTSWIILASVAALALWKTIQRQEHGWAANLLVLGVISILFIDPMGENLLYYRYQNGNRDDWKGALTYVAQHRQPNDGVIVGHHLVGDFYLNEPTVDIYSLTLEDLQTLDRRTWLVEDMNVPERRPEMHDWILKNAQLVGSFDVHVRARTFVMRVYLFEPGQEIRPIIVR